MIFLRLLSKMKMVLRNSQQEGLFIQTGHILGTEQVYQDINSHTTNIVEQITSNSLLERRYQYG